METVSKSGVLRGRQTEDEMKNVARSDRKAIYVSNITNLVLLIVKVCASYESRSLAVTASTLALFINTVSAFHIWFTLDVKINTDLYHYPVEEYCMQPDERVKYIRGHTVFSIVMLPLCLLIFIESARELLAETHPIKDYNNELWVIGIMYFVAVVKSILILNGLRFKNDILRFYTQYHLLDIVFHLFGLSYDPVGGLAIAFCTIILCVITITQEASSLIPKSPSIEFLAKLTCLVREHCTMSGSDHLNKINHKPRIL